MKLNHTSNRVYFLVAVICLGWPTEQSALERFTARMVVKAALLQSHIPKLNDDFCGEDYDKKNTDKISKQKNNQQASQNQTVAVGVSPSGSTHSNIPAGRSSTQHTSTSGVKLAAPFVPVLGVAGTGSTAVPAFITGAMNVAAPVVIPVVAVGGASALVYVTVKHGPKAVYEVVKVGIVDFLTGPNTHSRNYAYKKQCVKEQEEFITKYPSALYFTVLEKHSDGSLTEETYLGCSPDPLDYRMHVTSAPANPATYEGTYFRDGIIATSTQRPLIVGYDKPSAFKAQQAAQEPVTLLETGTKGPCIGKPIIEKPTNTGCGQPPEQPKKQNPGCGPEPVTDLGPLVTPVIDPEVKKQGGCGGAIEQGIKGSGILHTDGNVSTDTSSDKPILQQPETQKETSDPGVSDSFSEDSIQGAVVDQILSEAALISTQQEKGVVKTTEEIDFSVEKTSERGWNLSETGSIINDRYYTQHALERMAPDTVEVRAILEKRAFERGIKKFVTDKKGKVKANPEWKKMMDVRNIPPMVVESVISEATPIEGLEIYAGTFNYSHNGITIVLNVRGDVVTVIRS